MPAAKRAVAVNIGMQTVTMAVFELSGDSGLVLSGLARADLLPDPAMDASRPGQLKIAIGEMQAKLKMSSAACAITIPSQGVFTRFVKIPKVAADQAGKMLFFEAQQNVPYPIEEVSWCYQVIPEKQEDKLGALILAAKLDQLEDTVSAVRKAGLSPAFIETSPTALYNSLRYNYPDLGGCTLLIDIGARATNLIFSEADKLFVRTLPVGGSSITAALQKRFEGRSLVALEDAKVKEGFVAPPGNFDAQGGDAAEIGKIARTVMTRIHNEITRSITFYRTNQQGSSPMRVLLTGGGAAMPYTLEFFNEKLSLPIEFFDPLRRVSVAPSAGAEIVRRSSLTLGECTGMATRMLLGDCPLEAELQSPGVKRDIRAQKRRPFLIAAVALLAAVVGVAILHYKSSADALSLGIADANDRISRLEKFKQQIDETQANRQKLFADAADLVSYPLLRTAWPSILNELSSRMPPRSIWITQLRPLTGDEGSAQPGGEQTPAASTASLEKPGAAVTAIELDGLYLANEVNEAGPAVVDQFVDSLVESALFRIDPATKNAVLKVRSNPDDTKWAFDYKLILPLRRPIPL